MVTTFSISSGRSKGPILGVIFPLSILDISRTSLIRLSRCWLESSIFFRQSSIFSGSFIWEKAIFVMPTMAFIGVRISWLMRERKSDFARFAFSALSSALLSISVRSSSLHLSSRSTVTSVMSIKTAR